MSFNVWKMSCGLLSAAYLARQGVLAFTVPRVPAAWTRASVGSMKMMATASVESPTWTTPGYRRPLHWVFKIGDLKKSLDFYEKDFGMHVHRHEEFASGCEATCNGPYGGAWSKTMCGFGQEDENFALELTYNYGIDSYAAGNDLRYIAIDQRAYKGPEGNIETDGEGRRFVSTPDGYKYLLVDTGEAGPCPKEPFLFVSIHVSDLAKSEKYYREVLGAWVYYGLPGTLRKPKTLTIGFEDNGVKLELVQLPDGGRVDFKLASGRFATETEDGAPDMMADKVKAAGGKILHGPLKLQPHGEEVVIVADPDGYEYCFVDARGYKKCVDVRDAKDGRKVDWDYREKLEAAARSGPKAKFEVAKVLAGEYDSKAVRNKIDSILRENDVVVFAQVQCPYCAKAKALLKELGVHYKLVEVDSLGPEGYAFRVELHEMTGRSSVPNIFIRGQNIGGFGDGPGLEALHKDGKLLPLLDGKATLAELKVKSQAVSPEPAAEPAKAPAAEVAPAKTTKAAAATSEAAPAKTTKAAAPAAEAKSSSTSGKAGSSSSSSSSSSAAGFKKTTRSRDSEGRGRKSSKEAK